MIWPPSPQYRHNRFAIRLSLSSPVIRMLPTCMGSSTALEETGCLEQVVRPTVAVPPMLEEGLEDAGQGVVPARSRSRSLTDTVI